MKEKYGKGQFLIAAGALIDHNFFQTVVLLCEHQREGSYGLILNRPLEDIEELTEKMPFVGNKLFQGGPVQPEIMQFLHPYGEQIAGSLKVTPGVWLGGDFTQLQDGFGHGRFDPEACRFYLGYSGWSENQLDQEIKNGFWLSVPATPELVFKTASEKLRSQLVRKLGEGNPLYRFLPDDPSWN
jgi:putative transcriptional regulator